MQTKVLMPWWYIIVIILITIVVIITINYNNCCKTCRDGGPCRSGEPNCHSRCLPGQQCYKL